MRRPHFLVQKTSDLWCIHTTGEGGSIFRDFVQTSQVSVMIELNNEITITNLNRNYFNK